MKKLLAFFAFFILFSSISGQVSLIEAKKHHENKDSFLYLLPQNLPENAEYLGKMEINNQGMDETELFHEFYKKAKLVGANAYQIITTDNLENQPVYHRNLFAVNLYYVEQNKIPNEDNFVYLIANQHRSKIRVNDKRLEIQPKTYLKIDLNTMKLADVAVGGFLGSRIEFSVKNSQPNQYFEIKNANVRSKNSPFGGINIKSGDFVMLEKSYAQFLISLFQEKKL